MLKCAIVKGSIYKKIIISADGTKLSKKAVVAAPALALEFNAVLTLVHVVPHYAQMDLGTMMPLMFGMLGLGAYRTAEKIQGVAR
ncbi:MAG: universal stress protein [Betaproteobacteria bacterium]